MNLSRDLSSSKLSVHKCGSRRGLAILAVLAFVVSLVFAPSAFAARQKPTITDTQNLLGAKSSSIQDSIDSLQKDTGVTLNLLFVDTFGLKKLDKQTIGDWADARLAFTKPAPNTLLLAVASQDGQMALAASKGSEGWITSNIDSAFPDAAAKPLAQKDPDWPGSVIALVRQIRKAKADHDSLPWRIGGGILIALVAIAAVVGCVLLVRWLRRIGFFASHSGRHAAPKGNSHRAPGPRRGHRGRHPRRHSPKRAIARRLGRTHGDESGAGPLAEDPKEDSED